MPTAIPGAALPKIERGDDFDAVVKKLARQVCSTFPRHFGGQRAGEGSNADEGRFFVEAIESPYTFEELRSAVYGRSLKPLVRYLVDDVHYEGVVSALL